MGLAYEPNTKTNRVADYVGPTKPRTAPQLKPLSTKGIRNLPFHPHTQLVGTLKWLCPACGGINRTRLAPASGWRIECGTYGCGAVFYHGSTLWQIPRGSAARRPLDDPFPEANTEHLDRGRYIHSAVPMEELDEQPTQSNDL